MILTTKYDNLIELAKEHHGNSSTFDWSTLNIDEDSTFRLITSQIMEMYHKAPASERELILLSTVISLSVDNYLLNLINEATKQGLM